MYDFFRGKLLIPANKKSVKLFADCLFICLGSRKPFSSNKHEIVHARRREPSHLILDGNLRDFKQRRIRATSSIIF